MRLPKLHPVMRWRAIMRRAAERKAKGLPEFDYETALLRQRIERQIDDWRRENINAV